MRISTWLGAGIALLLGNTASSQQLKLGKNPYTVQKSAVLELNSDNQGLLLVRLSDTIAINTLTPPDGMVIFFTPTKQLMVRSNGSWQPLTGGTIINNLNGLTASAQTFATGTTGTDFNISSSGTIHTFNLPDASASARGLLTTGAQIIAGAKTFSSPLTLIGVQTGTNTTADSLLTITSGLVRKLPMSTFVTTGSFWALGGNSVTTIKNFGTIDNNHLPFITNNTERMRISNTGNVGIGTTSFDPTNPEKLLVQAGITTSYNLIEGHGKINSYLQFNIQNDSSGSSSSSDLVATANNGDESVNYVDMGINSSGYGTPNIVGGANNAYLYSTGNNFIIGNGSASRALVLFTGGLTTSNERMRIDGSGHVGIGTTSPTADLHLAAGTTSANTAPLKFTSGNNLSTAEDGAVEYDGTNYFVSVGTVRYTLAKTLTATSNLNFPITGPGSSSTLTITVTGAADGDVVSVGVPNAAASAGGICFTAYVSAANTVTVKLNNYNLLASVDPNPAVFRVTVIKY
ncbi:MAG TPA: hypothetical protein VL832_03630 [Puia sp.]|nr:hypothetical protein [Puia sp.]